MEELVKPSEYAKELGISRQAVYAKIKKGILNAKEIEGQLYIIRGEEKEATLSSSHSSPSRVKRTTTSQRNSKFTQETITHYQTLLESKDETIDVLKGTVKDLKKSNKHISKTLRGEVNLLKEAFYEMRTLYKHKIDHIKESYKLQESPEKPRTSIIAEAEEDAIDVDSIEQEQQREAVEQVKEKEQKQEQAQTLASWISAKKFLKQNNITNKNEQERILKVLRKAFKKGDARFSVIEGKLKLDINKSYGDIVKI
jgi:predicted DNA-binding protein YlxM (UPF0122 family)